MDFGCFQACYTGAGAAPGEGCGDFDFDIDGDIDQTDFEFFHGCMGGANQPVEFNCEH